MGSGASSAAGVAAAVDAASPADLQACLQGLGLEERKKFANALTQEGPATMSFDAGNSEDAATNGAPGGAEITGDEELEFELTQQELMFQKCMRKRMEREAKRKLEKQQRKEANEKKCREAMEQAFEGELDKLLDFFGEGFPIDTMDPYGTTLLSEAAAGGADDCVEILVGEGADVNNIGRNRRTPLWRAANAGHARCVRMLLRAGGDPRIPDEHGAKPYHVANGADTKSLLECWDVSVTEKMLEGIHMNQKKLERERKAKDKMQREEMSQANEAAERRLQIAKTEVARIQKLVVTYRQQRVSLAETGEIEKMQDAEPHLKRAEAELETAKGVYQSLEWELRRVRLKVRDFENKLRRKSRKDGEEPNLLDQVILIKDLADVVVRDVGGKRLEDGRWPLIFDPAGNAATFFTYSGVVFNIDELSMLSASDNKEDRNRLLMALLNNLKYGGPVAIHLGNDFGKMEQVEDAFNYVEKGFFNTITDRSVLYSYLMPRRFLHLVPPEQKDDYCNLMFDDEHLAKFLLCFIVSAEEPIREVMEKQCHPYYCIKVRDPDAERDDIEEQD
mmetsp:Transcript_55595/g.110492  ORF Transcript_55595/g.110492 Transcript_55595/m.110492 type:complete len:562 (-) Transcript_55595:72-1757(-)